MKNAFEYEAELAALREELANTYRAACELANAMTRDVPDLSPEFELFDYTCGVIGQIDNMYAGMRSERNALQQRLTAAEQRNAELVELLRDAACAVKGHAMTAWAVPLYVRINNALAQPTESGASE